MGQGPGTVKLQRLRITGGTTMLTDCLVEGNGVSSRGGGIYVTRGRTTLAGSTVGRDNRSDANSSLDGGGGGIFVEEATLVIAETCRVTENTAPAREGGIFNGGGTATLQGAEPSLIVVDNCPENCLGNVPKCAAGGFCLT